MKKALNNPVAASLRHKVSSLMGGQVLSDDDTRSGSNDERGPSKQMSTRMHLAFNSKINGQMN
jgi:hypothetical protein